MSTRPSSRRTDATVDAHVEVVVETPTGSRNKYEMDVERGRMRLDRRLPSATVFPADYGFVPDTIAHDGDPLDALVLVEEPTFPGCVVVAKVLGLFKMHDEKGSDAKLVTVLVTEPRWSDATDIGDIPRPLLDEIEHFFHVYKDLEPHKATRTEGFEGVASALDELRAARRAAGQKP